MMIQVQNFSVALIYAFINKCWTILTPVWKLWGVSVNYTIRFLISDLHLQKQSHNNGLSGQGVPNNRCQLHKQTPAPSSI